MNSRIAIIAIASFSPFGHTSKTIWDAYKKGIPAFKKKVVNFNSVWMASLSEESQIEIETIQNSSSKYKNLDASVLYAIAASRNAIQQAGWSKSDAFGINIGSSRGATHLFEHYHREYIETGIASTLSSPTTTLGNIASWVSNDLQNNGPEISHSITCSTALHSLLNGIAWIKAGMSTRFLVGGSEAPLTDFTIAQMLSLKIYSKDESEFPCKALDFNKKHNSMILGEGASMCCLEVESQKPALAYIEGYGYATEILEHNTSLSSEADCFQKSMKMALKDIPLNEIDAIVMHAPGTVKGDLAEFKAIQKVFGNDLPLLTSNKWLIGHTFGASGMLNIEMAILMLQHQEFIATPFYDNQNTNRTLRKILVNAVGFGGNAVSILLSHT